MENTILHTLFELCPGGRSMVFPWLCTSWKLICCHYSPVTWAPFYRREFRHEMKSAVALILGASFRDLRSETWVWFDFQDGLHSRYFLSSVPRLRQLGKSPCSLKGTNAGNHMGKVCSKCLVQRSLGTSGTHRAIGSLSEVARSCRSWGLVSKLPPPFIVQLWWSVKQWSDRPESPSFHNNSISLERVLSCWLYSWERRLYDQDETQISPLSVCICAHTSSVCEQAWRWEIMVHFVNVSYVNTLWSTLHPYACPR